MHLNADTIQRAIQSGFPTAEIEVCDLRGDGTYFTATVVSAEFQGMRLLDQHRLVYKTLAGTIGDTNTHMLQLTTRAGQKAS